MKVLAVQAHDAVEIGKTKKRFHYIHVTAKKGNVAELSLIDNVGVRALDKDGIEIIVPFANIAFIRIDPELEVSVTEESGADIEEPGADLL